MFRRNVLAGLLSGCLVAVAQTPVALASEARFQLDLHVPDAAIQALLPQGFTLNVATQGPAKDCNVRLVFIDRVSVNAPDGKPLGKGASTLAYLVSPVKDASGANAQLVVGGLTSEAADAPGPFGNYIAAGTHTVKRSLSSGAGPAMESQDWVFRAASGEYLEMHIQFERGVGNRGKVSDTKFYSAKTPAYYQISRQEQVLDILKNTTTNPPDRVKEFSLKAGGGTYAKMFDGTEKMLSWDNIIWLNRTVLVPQAGN